MRPHRASEDRKGRADESRGAEVGGSRGALGRPALGLARGGTGRQGAPHDGREPDRPPRRDAVERASHAPRGPGLRMRTRLRRGRGPSGCPYWGRNGPTVAPGGSPTPIRDGVPIDVPVGPAGCTLAGAPAAAPRGVSRWGPGATVVVTARRPGLRSDPGVAAPWKVGTERTPGDAGSGRRGGDRRQPRRGRAGRPNETEDGRLADGAREAGGEGPRSPSPSRLRSTARAA